MGKRSSLFEYWLLLDLAEDFLRDGNHRPHPTLVLPPPLRREGRTSSAAAEAAGAAAVGEVAPGASLADIAAQVKACTRCALHRGRRQAVPGEGAATPRVLVIGEGPGAEEDATGRPFVGPAGQLLDRMLKAIALDRNSNCFIANVVKCRPPGNRDPLPEESAACLPYLRAQIAALRPQAILAVGRVAAQTLTGLTAGVGELRRRQLSCEGIPLAVTYHPSAVLRDSSLRRPVWEDLKRMKSTLGDA
jgi:DNA polymerase